MKGKEWLSYQPFATPAPSLGVQFTAGQRGHTNLGKGHRQKLGAKYRLGFHQRPSKAQGLQMSTQADGLERCMSGGQQKWSRDHLFVALIWMQPFHILMEGSFILSHILGTHAFLQVTTRHTEKENRTGFAPCHPEQLGRPPEFLMQMAQLLPILGFEILVPALPLRGMS